jgi:hypothetical protein
MEVKRLPGFIERIPSERELDQAELPKILLKQVQEIQEEIDSILRQIGDKERANAPWESNEALAKLDQLKAASARLAGMVK